MKIFYLSLVTVMGLVLSWCPPVLATITLKLDPSKVSLGETFTLTLTLESSQSNERPDLIPLQKNFTIVGTERSINYSLFNGQAHSVSQWSIFLTAKHKGLLTIPPIRVGSEQTTARQIEVSERAVANEPSQSAQKDILLITEVNEKNPYVNQEVIYTVKLYNSQRLLNADYQPPEIEDGLLIPLGEGQRYQASQQGRMYEVEEQRYAIFPQKSGRLNIKPPQFNAVVYDVIPKRISVQGNSSFLEVKSTLQNNSGTHGLPAKQVYLNEYYDKNTDLLTQGTTLVRTVTIQAVAAPAQLLPDLDFGSAPQWSVYSQKPSEKNTLKGGDLVGTRTIKVTYLFNEVGAATIPSLKLPWFNTVTGKEEVAFLPEHRFDVVAVSTGSQQIKEVSSSRSIHSLVPKQHLVQSHTIKKPQMAFNSRDTLAWWIAFGFALAWLLTLGFCYGQRRNDARRLQSRSATLNRLKEACLANKPLPARDALIQWARLQWPNQSVLTLYDLEKLIAEEMLKKQIEALSGALYQENSSCLWQGILLWQSFVAFNAQKSTKTTDTIDPLPPMNP